MSAGIGAGAMTIAPRPTERKKQERFPPDLFLNQTGPFRPSGRPKRDLGFRQ